MNEALHPAVKLQGDIMMMLVKNGDSAPIASALACEIIHMMLTSNVVTPEMRAAYAAGEVNG